MNNLRRVAVIDCGTNTFNLRVVDVGASAGWIPVFGQRIPVRLGQGGVAKGVIRPDRMARGLDALVSMREALRNYRVEEIHVLATSAMRDAKNGHEFVAQAKELTGFDIQIISGQHEARLIQEGILLNFPEPPTETCLTMDIGGGSVEFIVWDAEGMKWTQSFDTGVARLHMLMGLPDPLGHEGVAKMRPYFDDVMAPLAAAMEALKPTLLVGASGSFDTIADLVGTRTRTERPDHAQSPEPHPVTDPVPMRDWEEVARQLIECDVHHRTAMPGMDPARVDLMPFSAGLIQWVLEQGTVTRMCRAPYALREGVLSRLERALPLLPEL
jgi:exopolyphosphatase/guanosine-5'-triphosphate,3'-diphosphate pyrophosphatase